MDLMSSNLQEEERKVGEGMEEAETAIVEMFAQVRQEIIDKEESILTALR